jgi:3-oxoacyl-[acyl-carrier-protein] synthase II
MSAARVVITGIGLALPAGRSAAEVTDRALAGESAIGPLRRFDAAGYACRASAEVAPFDLAGSLRIPKNEKFMSRPVACAIRAALDAVQASGLDPAAIDPHRFGVYAGMGQTGLETSEFFAALEVAETGDAEGAFRNLGGRASRLVDRYWSLRTLANAGIGLLAAELSARGPCNNFVQDDTASAHALAAGYHDLLEGRCDAVVAGGCESLLTPSNYLAYDRAGLLSPSDPSRAYRPFDRDRDGLVLGEGAAFVVLEREADARRRGAPVLGELLGAGFAQAADGGGKASPETPLAAMREALDGARPDAVVAHGIGTREDDAREAASLGRAGLGRTPITALKGLTGYLGAATAAAELCVVLLAARQRAVPPVARLESADEACSLDFVTGGARGLDAREPLVLSLSWSWSGQCAALAARALPA